MPTSLVVENGIVKTVRKDVLGEMPLTDFIQKLTADMPRMGPLLPPNCVDITTFTRKGIPMMLFVIELKASIYDIAYGRQPIKLKLSWPTTLWFITCAAKSFDSVHIAALPNSIREATDYRAQPLYTMPLPNQRAETGLCFGDVAVDMDAPLHKRIPLLLETVIQGSRWNNDLAPNWRAFGLAGIEEWHRLSAEDPHFGSKLLTVAHAFPTYGDALTRLTCNGAE
jgi:hypothetical protein